MSRSRGKTKDQSENNNNWTTATALRTEKWLKKRRAPYPFTWRFDELLVVDILLRVPKDALEPVVLDVLRVGEDVGVVALSAALPLPKQVEAVKVGAAPPAPALLRLTVHGGVAEGVTRATKPCKYCKRLANTDSYIFLG